MHNRRTLECNLDDAVHMIQAGLATVDQVANAYGIAANTLQAHLSGIAPARTCGPQASGGLLRNFPQWHFAIDGADWMWHVTRADGTKVAAPRRFSTLEDCIDDAKLHGYVVWSPESEPRGEGQ